MNEPALLPLSMARLWWLKTVVAVAEGAAVVPTSSTSTACVAAVLKDCEGRLTVLGGRDGMPRSFGGVYAGAVARFLNARFSGRVTRRFALPRMFEPSSSSIAVSPDGVTLYVGGITNSGDELLPAGGYGYKVLALRVPDGAVLHTVGSSGSGALQFNSVDRLTCDPDGDVFVLERANKRVQQLTPALTFKGIREIGAWCSWPMGIAVTKTHVFVLDNDITVFPRDDGSPVVQFRYGLYVGYGLHMLRTLGQLAVSVSCGILIYDTSGTHVRQVERNGAFNIVDLPGSEDGTLLLWRNDTRTGFALEDGRVVAPRPFHCRSAASSDSMLFFISYCGSGSYACDVYV